MDIAEDDPSYIDRLRKLGHLNKQTTAYKQQQLGPSNKVNSRSIRHAVGSKAPRNSFDGPSQPQAT